LSTLEKYGYKYMKQGEHSNNKLICLVVDNKTAFPTRYIQQKFLMTLIEEINMIHIEKVNEYIWSKTREKSYKRLDLRMIIHKDSMQQNRSGCKLHLIDSSK